MFSRVNSEEDDCFRGMADEIAVIRQVVTKSSGLNWLKVIGFTFDCWEFDHSVGYANRNDLFALARNFGWAPTIDKASLAGP